MTIETFWYHHRIGDAVLVSPVTREKVVTEEMSAEQQKKDDLTRTRKDYKGNNN